MKMNSGNLPFEPNASTLGSKGRPYPDISNMTTTHDVRKMRPDIKILTGHDYKDMAFHLK